MFSHSSTHANILQIKLTFKLTFLTDNATTPLLTNDNKGTTNSGLSHGFQTPHSGTGSTIIETQTSDGNNSVILPNSGSTGSFFGLH